MTTQTRIPAKHCTKCGEYKPLTEFWRASDGAGGRKSYCGSCGSDMNARYKATPQGSAARVRGNQKKEVTSREWLWLEKSKPCERCGNTYHPVAMQFDHLPGFEKKFTLKVGSRSIETLKTERAKCQLLCANCHHIVTWERKTGNTVDI